MDVLHERDVTEPWVLEAMAAVPREDFVGPEQRSSAYADRPLPIGLGQTISQPSLVAGMAQWAEVQLGDQVLEIGTGSGYGAAILAFRAEMVVTVERLDELADAAAERLASLSISNVEVVVGDGTLGWPQSAPYDAIVVTAAGPKVPQALVEQLADGGRLIMPVGNRRGQRMIRLRRIGTRIEQEILGDVRFVPLIGADGYRP